MMTGLMRPLPMPGACIVNGPVPGMLKLITSGEAVVSVVSPLTCWIAQSSEPVLPSFVGSVTVKVCERSERLSRDCSGSRTTANRRRLRPRSARTAERKIRAGSIWCHGRIGLVSWISHLDLLCNGVCPGSSG
jgi:hypothetical protein